MTEIKDDKDRLDEEERIDGGEEEIMQKNLGYWGFCTECKEPADDILNVGKGHWAICLGCKTQWFVGANVFGSWRSENEEIWKQNSKLLFHYREIEPLYECSVCRIISDDISMGACARCGVEFPSSYESPRPDPLRLARLTEKMKEEQRKRMT